MVDRRQAVAIGVSAGVAAAVLTAACVAIWMYRRRASVAARTRSVESSSATLRADGSRCASLDSSVSVSVVSESVADWGHPPPAKRAAFWAWRGGAGHNGREPPPLTVSGIPKYHYKDLQKATSNFTTILGQGSFGPVYKAVMATGEVVAVKVLASDSRQGEREFQTEVALLSRLHHRNLVNLVGYCVEKGDNKRSLSWEERLQIAHDISHGIEYLHEGAVPPVIHRDLKSDNILLDHSMRAKVADFGLSKEEVYDGSKSGLKAIGGEGRVDWDEILDKDLLVGNIPEEVRMLADVAYRCVNKSPRKRPWIPEVTQAISRLRQRQLTKHDALTLPRSETRTVLRRIEYQHVELSDLTSMKELTPIRA
nr:unnamed protein product [Digitaria exilis]